MDVVDGEEISLQLFPHLFKDGGLETKKEESTVSWEGGHMACFNKNNPV